MHDSRQLDVIRHAAHIIEPDDDYGAVARHIGQASIVLMGESTHGTREFYRMRARLSRRLILQEGFDAIAIEADWPDALRVNRYIKHAEYSGQSGDHSAVDALGGFERFPLWMWRNVEFLELVDWLHGINAQRPDAASRIGLFGLDLYSLRKSMDAVIGYLEQTDPDAAGAARARYACFDHAAEDPQRYGYAANCGLRPDCENEVVQQLVALQENSARLLSADGPNAADELFYAQQNARVAQNAEAYYRSMYQGRDESWNLRDTHMADTLDALMRHIERQKGRPARIIVWAHNSHIGDARATEMGEHGQLNLGQLARQRHGDKHTYLLGFSTHTGSVTAAPEWDSPAHKKAVRPSRPDSHEHLLHQTGLGNFFLPIRAQAHAAKALGQHRLERAIGVIYLPSSERTSHYFHADMARQFDAVIHVDRTHALHPLDRSPHWTHEEVPETYPFGI